MSGSVLDTSEQVKVPILMCDPSWGERGNALVHRVLVALSQGPARITKGVHCTRLSGAQGVVQGFCW